MRSKPAWGFPFSRGVSFSARSTPDRSTAIRLADMDPEIQYVYICRKKQIPSSAQKAFVEMLTKMA